VIVSEGAIRASVPPFDLRSHVSGRDIKHPVIINSSHPASEPLRSSLTFLFTFEPRDTKVNKDINIDSALSLTH
jgi:hypothetical protein